MKAPRINPGRALVVTAAVAAALAPATANAAEQADLRVEGAAGPLAAATYLTDTARIKTTSSSSCKGSGDVKTVQGPTALGLLWSGAAATKRLRPVAVSDEFDFGLLVCGISSFVGGDTAYWLYKVDHKSPEVGAEQYPLKGGEQVLWYFSDTTANVNTGDELALQAPARAKPGSTVAVRVWSYDTAGKRTPAAGAVVQGEDEATTDAQGRATARNPGPRDAAAASGARSGHPVADRVGVHHRQAELPVAPRQADPRHREGRPRDRHQGRRTPSRPEPEPIA